jgi:hypothetical protein
MNLTVCEPAPRPTRSPLPTRLGCQWHWSIRSESVRRPRHLLSQPVVLIHIPKGYQGRSPWLVRSETIEARDEVLLMGHSLCHFFFPALTLAHLAFAAARIRARPAAEMRRLGRRALAEGLFALTFAHLARCAAAMRRRAVADRIREGRFGALPFSEVRALMARSIRFRSC